MTQYNKLNVKLSISQLNKLKPANKNGTEVILDLSSNISGDSNDENNFPHKLLVTNTQVWRLRKSFTNNSSAKIKLSKTQLYQIVQPRGFLGRLLGPLIKTELPWNVLKPLAKSVLIPLGLTAAASATDAAIQKKIHGSGTTKLIILNEEMGDIMNIIKSLENSGLLIEVVSETIQKEAKKQKWRFFSMLLGTLGASLLRNLLTNKGKIRAGEGTIRAGKIF